MRIKSLALYASLGLSLTAACRSDSNSPDSGGGSGIDSGSGGSGGSGSAGFKKIQDIQADSMTPGTQVDIQGVIVTAIDTQSSQKGNFWVEEPEGGEFSGILVHNGTLTDVSALAVGDEVTITGGIKAEFALTGSNGDTSGNTDTELEPASGGKLTIKKTGTGAVPAPVVVDALMIGSLSTKAECAPPNATTCATNKEWEKYEGVLIKVTSTGGGGVIAGGVTIGKTANTQDRFNITGQIDVESTLIGDGTTGSNSGLPPFASGDCLASVTGVLDYFFQYNLLPVTTADIATGGTGCPAREQAAGTTIGTCGDSMDNDGNGFSDCADLGCEAGSGAWLGASCTTSDTTCGCSTNTTAGASVSTANGETTNTPLILHNVVVTALAGTRGYWIADAAAGAANHGIFVFGSSNGITLNENLATVQGIAGPFSQSTTAGAQKVSEISNPTATAGTGTSIATPLTGQTAATLTNLTNGKTFAGVLVQLSNVKVTAVPTTANHNQATLTDGTTTFTMDDGAFFGYGSGSGATPPAGTTAVGTCYKTLTGVMDLQTGDQIRTINPRSALDMVAVGGNCP